MKKKVPSEKEIASKHGVSVKYVIRQAEIGSTVEREHTTSHEEAYGIALQHIAEFPDYYKHLLAMEKQLKKKWNDSKRTVKEESEEKRYCPLCKKEETKSQCSYGPSAWEMASTKISVEEDHKEIASGEKVDDEGYMANLELDQIERSVQILRKLITKPDQQLPAWVQSKITRAADFIDTAAEYLSSDETTSEEVNKSFEKFISESAAWTKKEGKNKNGGLNEKGRKSYESENPGSDLKAPSKEVGNPRRKSFCARMKGMKSKLTSKKTASDPDSRINKSLRAWNC
jgi:hypothetical protein